MKLFKMKQILIALALLVLLSYCTTSKTPNNKKDPIIANIGEKSLKRSEFVYAYNKSLTSQDSAYSKSSLDEYLQLMIDFKLKVIDAERLNLQQNNAFKQEMQSYERIVAKNFLIDPAALDSIAMQAYERSKEQVNVSHILYRVPELDDPADTLKAYQEMQKIRQEALNASDFGKIAQRYSQDQSARENRGKLGYFTALQMVYPFENVAYQTSKGEVSPIFRSKYGYHILKVHDRRPNVGKLRTAHIMVALPSEADKETASKARNKIQEAYQRLEQGENWEEICTKYSDDATSREKGGELPAFGVGTVLPPFEEAAFALQSVGEYSKPFLTSYGWHIVKLLERETLPSKENLKDRIRQEFNNTPRYDVARQALIRQLKASYKPEVQQENLNKAFALSNPKLLEGTWAYDAREALVNEPLLSLKSRQFKKEKAYKVRDFLDFVYLKQSKQPQLQDHRYYMEQFYPQFIEQVLIDFEKENLYAKKPDFALLMQEYYEGNLVYTLTETKVWQKSLQDTSAVRAFFEQNRQNYKWGERATAVIYELPNEEVLNQLNPYLLRNTYQVSKQTLPTLYFDKNSATLNQASLATLNQLVEQMKKDPKLSVEIEAHIDPTENEDVSAKRLAPIVKYLTFKDIDLNRITTRDFGFTKPTSARDRSKNRRAEIQLFTSDKTELENILSRNLPAEQKVKIEEGIYEKGQNPYLEQVNWKPGSYTIRPNGKVVYIEIKDLKQPRLKDYDEARGFAITDYQKALERKWIDELKTKYEVQINQEELYKLIR